YGARLASGESPPPNLDALAAGGLVYREARATTSWTLPSHTSLFTGLPELAHAVEQDGERLAQEIPTLAETLAQAGYRTFGVYSGPYLDPRYGFARGFARYERGYGAELARAADELETVTELLARIDSAREPERAEVARERLARAERALEVASHADVSAARVAELAREELVRASRDARPFFLFAHFFDAHYDYRPPEQFLHKVDPEHTTDPALSCSPVTTDPESVASCRLRYQGEVAWLDAEVGRVLDELARLDLAENTLVVVVSDHGDEFLEHGALGHRRTLHEEVLRVPVIVRFPGRVEAGKERDGATPLFALHDELLAHLGVRAERDSVSAPVARLVRPEYVELELGSERVRANRLHVLESFWHAGLVLRRERVLLRAIDPLPVSLRTVFEQRARSEFAREELLWAPLAPPGQETWSSDFTGAAARVALDAFRTSYALWTGQRRAPRPTEDAEGLAAALRGLGYAGFEGTFSVESDALVLPPPGN
ncbi:MAG: sulfatase, partial [Planctomycetota bacterium]